MKPQNMRLFFFIYLFTFFYFSSFSADFSPLERAEKLFENGLYTEASTLYDSLINKEHFKSLIPDGFVVMFAGNIGEAQDFDSILCGAKRLIRNFTNSGRRKILKDRRN